MIVLGGQQRDSATHPRVCGHCPSFPRSGCNPPVLPGHWQPADTGSGLGHSGDLPGWPRAGWPFLLPVQTQRPLGAGKALSETAAWFRPGGDLKTWPKLCLWFAGMSSAKEPSNLHPSAACGFANEAFRGPGGLPAKELGDSRLWGLCRHLAIPSPGRPRPGEASALRPLGTPEREPQRQVGCRKSFPYCGHCVCTQLLSRIRLFAAPWWDRASGVPLEILEHLPP